jgi:hypothetical protein
MEAEPYPFDYDNLPKGSIITPEMVESMTGGKTRATEGENGWNLELMRAKARVKADLLELARPATVVIKGEGLKILTDEEALEYSPKRFQSGLRIEREANQNLRFIDREQLRPESQRKHEEEVLRQGFLLTVNASAVKAIGRGDHKALGAIQEKFLPKPSGS